MTKPTAERISDLFHYDLNTGHFRRKTTIGNAPSQRAGYLAGSTNSKGYVVIYVDGSGFKAHRLAWLYCNGVWPINHVDHINGKKNDNRIANLRDATRSQNLQNQKTAHTNNPSGFLGVHWHAASNSWQAQIRVNRKRFHLGVFSTPELAHAAYVKAKRELHEGCTI